jgi:hypothetical protein
MPQQEEQNAKENTTKEDCDTEMSDAEDGKQQQEKRQQQPNSPQSLLDQCISRFGSYDGRALWETINQVRRVVS